jgi:hypothetical protein
MENFLKLFESKYNKDCEMGKKIATLLTGKIINTFILSMFPCLWYAES